MLEPGAFERFQREFTAVSPLQHSNIVRALAQGQQLGVRTPGVLQRIGQDRQCVERPGVQHPPAQGPDRRGSPLWVHAFTLAFL